MSTGREPYPTDVTDDEWAFAAPYLTLPREDADQRKHDLREVFNALRWLVKAGSPWRLLPHDFPPWPAVYQQARRWLAAGCFEAMAHDLRQVIRVSVMGGMTPEGKVYTLGRQESLNGSHTIEFLVHLRRVAGERLLVVWDGSPIHRRQAVQEFVAGTKGKVWVEALLGYAPDLNPWDEGGWNHLKHAEVRNLVCRDLEELHEQFHLAISRLRQKPRLVQAFFAQAGLGL